MKTTNALLLSILIILLFIYLFQSCSSSKLSSIHNDLDSIKSEISNIHSDVDSIRYKM